MKCSWLWASVVLAVVTAGSAGLGCGADEATGGTSAGGAAGTGGHGGSGLGGGGAGGISGGGATAGGSGGSGGTCSSPDGPMVTGVSGTLADGASITVLGCGFGEKVQAAPVKFDTFDDGSNGALLRDHDPQWQPYDAVGLTYSNEAPHSGSLCVGHHNTDGEMFVTNSFTYAPASQEIFVSYWWKVDVNSAVGTIVKMTRMSSSSAAGGGGVYNGAGATTLGGTYDLASPGAGPYCAFTANAAGDDETPCTGSWDTNYLPAPPTSTWIKVDFHKKLSTPGSADGAIGLWSPGSFEIDRDDVMTRGAGASFLMDTVLLGTMDGSDEAHDYYVYLDDVYVDTSQARVEICDSANWAARSRCEIQPATAWSTTSATVTLNRGSFSPSDGAYLYVVEPSGRVNAGGRSVTFGSP